MTELQQLRDAVRDAPYRAWLDTALTTATERPDTIALPFTSAGRHAGRAALPDAPGWTAAEAVRTLLLAALPPNVLPATVQELYWQGDAEEKLAILKALAPLRITEDALPLLHDALRTNDHRLVATAVGPCGRRLDQAAWRQAVLKCVFMGIPLTAVDGLAERADAELARMLGAFADERTAASRTVPADATELLHRLTRQEI